MKFNTISRIAMAATVSVAIAFGTTACIRDYTSDYVYAVSNANGQVSEYGVDYQSGVLTQLASSPLQTNLSNPSTMVAAPNGKTVYAIGGSQNAQIQAMPVGSDGKLYGGTMANIPAAGTYPTAAAIDSTGSFLYVTYTYQNGYGPNSPGPGGVAIFPINTDGSLGTGTSVNVGNNPVAVGVSVPTCTTTPAVGGNGSPNCVVLGTNSASNNGTNQAFVYVVDAETAAAQATILGFVQDPKTGGLTPIPGTNPKGGFSAGVFPSAIAIDPTGKYVYVTDKAQNQVYGYAIANTTSGALIGLVTSPYATGQYPVAITIEPRGKYVYVANYNSQTVSSYTLNQQNGSLGATSGSNFTTTHWTNLRYG